MADTPESDELLIEKLLAEHGVEELLKNIEEKDTEEKDLGHKDTQQLRR